MKTDMCLVTFWKRNTKLRIRLWSMNPVIKQPLAEVKVPQHEAPKVYGHWVRLFNTRIFRLKHSTGLILVASPALNKY